MRNDLYKDLEEEKNQWYSSIPLMFIVSIIPLIVHGKLKELTGDYFKYWNGANKSFDFFSYYKCLWLLIGVGALLCVFAIRVIKKDTIIDKMKIYIPMGIYSLLVILSAVFSQYKEISLFGFVERYEGMIIIIAYMLILFITINMVKDENKIKAVLIALLGSAVIIGIIGLGQYFNYDLFKTDSIKKMLLPSEYREQSSKLKFQFGAKIIYSTLYHYNYVGSYMAMMFPLTLTMCLFIKNKFCKVGMAAVSFLMFLNLILCHSRAGIIGGIVSLVVLIVFIRRFIMQNYKYFIAAIAIAVVALVGFNVYSKGMLGNRVVSLFKDAGSLGKSNAYYIKDIYSENNTLKVETSKNNLTIISENNRLNFKDDKNNVIGSSVNQENGQVTLQSDKYKEISLNLKDYSDSNKKNNIQLKINDVTIPLLVHDNKFKFDDERRGELDIEKVDKWGFEGKEKLGSARSYIWSRSTPLLKHSFVLGYGPDTFAAKFPQDDFIGKILAYDTPSMLVDKVHNLYLENALNIGILGLIAFLTMFVMYIIDSFKVYFKSDFKDFYSIVGLSIFTAVCGYLGAGFFNDSVVSVAPVFWVLFGIGISINCKLKKFL